MKLIKQCISVCCGQEDNDDNEVREAIARIQEPLITPPKQQPLLMCVGGSTNFVLYRRTMKNFFLELKRNSLQNESVYYVKQYGIQKDNKNRLIPEKVLTYLVERCGMLSYSVTAVVPFSGCGQIPIHLALHLNILYVMAFESDMEDINKAIHNAELYDVHDKINFIWGSSALSFQQDVLIMYAQQVKTNIEWIDTHIPKLHRMARNFIFIIDYQDMNIDDVLSRFMKYFTTIKMEIKIINIDGESTYYCLFFGKIGAHRLYHELVTMSHLLLQDQQNKDQYIQKVQQLLQIIAPQLNAQDLLKLVLSATSTYNCETILNTFIYSALINQYITDAQLQDIFSDLYSDLALADTANYNQISQHHPTFEQSQNSNRKINQMQKSFNDNCSFTNEQHSFQY